MKRTRYCITVMTALSCLGLSSAKAGEEVSKLLSSYSCIERVAAKVRTTSSSEGGQVASLARVHFEQGGLLHVQNVVPLKRRIISDGVSLHYKTDEEPQGYRKTIEELDPSWLGQLRNVPGSPMEYLFPLETLDEDKLLPSDGAASAIGCSLGNTYVVLSFDDLGRLVRITYFESANLTGKKMEHRFSNFDEPCPGAWLARTHETVKESKGQHILSTTEFSNMAVNQPVHDVLFKPAHFFPDVAFVDRLIDTQVDSDPDPDTPPDLPRIP